MRSTSLNLLLRLASADHMSPMRLFLSSCTLVAFAGLAFGQAWERDLPSPAPAARFGEALGSAPDLDGDGSPEVLVGAPGFDGLAGADTGALFVYSGTALALYVQNGGPVPMPLLVLEGDSAGDELCTSVQGTRTGDYDQDGAPDLWLGAPLRDGVLGSDCGAVYLVSGAWLRAGAMGQLPSGPRDLLVLEGSSAGERFGHALDGSGDANADGVLDLAVGAPDYAGKGRADVLSGSWIEASIAGTTLPPKYLWSDSSAISVAPSPARYGWSLAWVGDFDLDEHDDLVVGAPSDSSYRNWSGSARVFSGDTFASITHVPGGLAAIPNNVGISVAGPGDTTGDGRPDILVGAPWESPNPSPCGSCCEFSGLVFLFHGPTAWPPSTWDAPYSVQTSGDAAGCHSTHLGRSVAGCGDFNGDGIDDAVLGQPDANEPPGVYVHGCGAVAIVRDVPLQSNQLIAKSIGGGAEHHLGAAVGGAGDLDLDGFADVLASAPGAGYVRILRGRPDSCSGPAITDCNGNGQNDACDVETGVSTDCNGNGVPDECDSVLASSVVPARGPTEGGNIVTLVGDGFVDGATLVLFDARPAVVTEFVSSSEMRVRVPAVVGAPGGRLGRLRLKVDVTVATCVDSATMRGGYTYELPER